jgi:hypothetical protein
LKLVKLLRRKRELPWKEGQEFCNTCFHVLTLKKSKIYGKTYWCPECKDWRYPDCYNIIRKRKAKIVPEILAMDTSRMKEKIGLYEEGFMERTKENIKVYDARVFSQEFLKSLIPKE